MCGNGNHLPNDQNKAQDVICSEWIIGGNWINSFKIFDISGLVASIKKINNIYLKIKGKKSRKTE